MLHVVLAALGRVGYYSCYVLVWLLMKIAYRVRVVGMDQLPAHGPALLVCNHVSFLDGLFIYLHAPRTIRFLVWEPYFKVPILGSLLRSGGAIPIAGEGTPRDLIRSLRSASEVLKQGGLVGIFAEGALSRTGMMLPFRRGFEQILKRSPAPIIPVALDRLWGSIFSYESGKVYWKWPKQWRYPVTLMIGQPMPADSPAWSVRQAVQKLMADSFNLRRLEHPPAHRLFVRMACKHPFRSCYIDPTPPGRELNFLKALTGAVLIKQRLQRRLGSEPMTGLLLPTVLGGALANIAVALCRKTAVNLNYTASKEAVLSAIQQCGIKQIVSSRQFRHRINIDLGSDVQYIDLEDIQREITPLMRLCTLIWLLLLPRVLIEYVWLKLGSHSCNDLATVIFSSGSTGDPKGVMLSHHNIMSNLESASQALNIRHTDRLLAVLPFFHSFGYTVTLWLPVLMGASTVYYPDPRQAKEVGEAAGKYRCTIFVATPTFLRFYLRRCQKEEFAHIRLLVTGAEKLPRSLADEFEKKFGFQPLEGYGCTELSPVVSVNVPDVEVDGFRQVGHKPGTIGQPIPGVAVAIVHPETNEPLPPGEPGMLLVYGPNVMEGYLHRPEQTREVIRDGWYVTGDIAQIDEDGFLTITDRLSRFSKMGGEMVPHQRIEEEIQTILGTPERVVAVTGVPDERKGERLVVLHAPLTSLTLDELFDRLKQAGLPNLWLPDRNCFFEVPEIPILGSGKLDLRAVKQLALNRVKDV